MSGTGTFRIKTEDIIEISDKKIDKRFKKNGQKKRGGNYCCVEGCRKNEWADRPETSFFKFPKRRNPEQHQLWLKAIDRVCADGSPWEPHPKNGLVCSEHFISGRPSKTRIDPDYAPSIFGTGQESNIAKQSGLRAKARSNRVIQRRLIAHTDSTSTSPNSRKEFEQSGLGVKWAFQTHFTELSPDIADDAAFEDNKDSLKAQDLLEIPNKSEKKTKKKCGGKTDPARVNDEQSGLKVEPLEDPLKDL